MEELIESKINTFIAWKNDRRWAHSEEDYRIYLKEMIATIIKTA